MLAPEYFDDGKCPEFTTMTDTRNNTCIHNSKRALLKYTYTLLKLEVYD